FDLVVSNPPYVPTPEIEALAPEVRDREPPSALDGGPDGLAVINRLVREAPARVRPGGWLLFEIGAGQDAAARQRVADAGFLPEKTEPDSDGIPRVVVGRKAP